MTDKDEEKAAKAKETPEKADDTKDEPPNPLKEWGAAIGLMIALALSFYALISMFKRGLD